MSTRTDDTRPILVTGGAGFIGCNLAERLLARGHVVRLFDNLARAGVGRNLEHLRTRYGERLEMHWEDVRDAVAVSSAVRGTSAVFHLAAQVAVTTSIADPSHDFDVNARGTLHVLEAIRSEPNPPSLVFTSTNKVYGAMEELALRDSGLRCEPIDAELGARGFGEDRRLAFHSPYGCSKGAADQYVRDYATTYGLPTVVFRMSCIYGPHQFGTEDQGWVAHFLIRALEGQGVTLYGDGRQVRDVLFVEDLVDALELAREKARLLAGRAFNIGGGPENTTSLLELLELLRPIVGERVRVTHEAPRLGDQRYYVSDTTEFSAATGWKPKTNLRRGLERLARWLREAHGVGPTVQEEVAP